MSGQIVVEKSPEYVHDLNTPPRIHDMNSSIKLMVLVCDPVRRAISEYVQHEDNHRRDGKEAHTFEYYAIDEQTGDVKPYNVVERGRYSVYMKTWLRQFHSDQIYVADGDQFRNNPVEELTNVESFLGLERYFDDSNFSFNEEKGFYCIAGNKCLGESKGRPHPVISANTLQALKTYYKPYNDQLFKQLGKTYNW